MGFIGLVATLVGLYQFFVPLFREAPIRRMTGDLNVAVASFTSAKGSRDLATGLSESAYETIERQLASASPIRQTEVDVETRGPEQVGPVNGSSLSEQAMKASQLARRLNADVLLYGSVHTGARGTFVIPLVQLNVAKLQDPETRQPVLTAVGLPPAPDANQELGAISVSSDAIVSIPARVRIRRELVARTRALAMFIAGLGYYSDALLRDDPRVSDRIRFAPALDYFSSALRAATWNPRVAAVFHLLAGNSAMKMDDFARAAAEYGAALKEQPAWARAHFGLAEVRFQRARGACYEGARVAGLRAALSEYGGVLRAVGDAPSLLRAKSLFAAGRTQVCLSLAGAQGQLTSAMESFRAVIRDFDTGFRAIQQQAAEAAAGIGLVDLQRGDPSGNTSLLTRSIGEYERAIALSTTSTRRGAFYAVIGYIYARLGEKNAAAIAYARAMRLAPESSAAFRREAAELGIRPSETARTP